MDDREYAWSVGVDPKQIADAFKDYHLAHGSLMADWHAAWRTWVRNSIKFSKAPGQRNLPLVAIMQTPDPADPYGAKAWASKLADARPDKMPDGSVAMCVGGYDAAGVAVDVCRAAGLPPDWRGDLGPIADWLRAGVDPDHIVQVIRSSRPPRQPGAWYYYDAKVRAA